MEYTKSRGVDTYVGAGVGWLGWYGGGPPQGEQQAGGLSAGLTEC